MACGSQKWNGNCADLVNAPSSTSTRMVSYSGCALITAPDASTCVSSKLPTTCPSSSTPASSASPPAPVIMSARRAPRRASASRRQNPIRRNELRLVSSQKVTSSNRFSASTTPSIAPMNSSSRP